MRLTGCVLAGMFFNTAAHAAVLFQDDFSGSTLDGSKWSLGTWTLGRTGLGNAPVVAGGIASLQFDTYNPDSPGTQFRGTEIYSNQSFARGAGLANRTSTRVVGTAIAAGGGAATGAAPTFNIGFVERVECGS